MRRNYEDFTGRVFGLLTVVERVKIDDRYGWLCNCECGNSTVVRSGNLKAGHTSSCGCLSKERSRKQLLKHGETKTRLYRIWENMRRRCDEATNKDYKNYGGRGIRVCDEWNMEYTVFRDWAISNGYSEDLTIDRIDVNGNYKPDNCRWVNCKKQCNNRRSNHIVEYNGNVHTIAEWSDITSIPPKTILYRLNAGWDIESVLTTPVNYRNRLVKHT